VSKRKAQVIILAEDKQHRTFVERLLKEVGYENRQLRPLPLPAGEGSGEQYVRERYAEEVGELRRRSGQVQLALVVILDADTREVTDRQRQLAEQLRSAGLDPRRDDERIVHLIPRRNVETWIAYLLGQQVNETDAYPRLKGRERDCQPAVEKLIEILRAKQAPADCPASLLAALGELRRLL
jgi:hypothetical protein